MIRQDRTPSDSFRTNSYVFLKQGTVAAAAVAVAVAVAVCVLCVCVVICPLRRTALPLERPKCLSFFPSPATIFILSSLSWVSSRGILVVFLKAGALKCERLGSWAVA